jgi:SRSO17 transposase
VPADTVVRTKPQLMQRMIKQAVAAGVRFAYGIG